MLYVHHPSSQRPDPRALSPEHPDSPARIMTIDAAIAQSDLPPLMRICAPQASDDELGDCRLRASSFGQLACHVRDLAAEVGAPVGAILEGGYHPSALGDSVVATIAALDGNGQADWIAPDPLVTPRVASHFGHFWSL
ncbi:MAG: hypothetical protein ACLPZR_16610 [Solirubrobacteraceae bacterium]